MSEIEMKALVVTARNLVGVANWKYAAKPGEAPEFVDCSSLTQWVYSGVGISIPRRSGDQLKIIQPRFHLEKMRAGDLMFVTSPYVGGRKTETQTGVHVCLSTGEGTVICASNSELGTGVVEITLEKILETRELIAFGTPL